MTRCLILFDGDDFEISEKIKRHISNFGVIVDVSIKGIADFGLGENIDDFISSMIETCDCVIYMFSANTDIEKMISLSKIKPTYALYVSDVAEFVIEYIEKEPGIIITPKKSILEIGWHKGISLAMQQIFGKKADRKHRLKIILLWIPRPY